MNTTKTVLVMALSFLGGVARAADRPADPMAQIKSDNERVQRILKQKAGNEDARKAQMKEIVNGFLDYEALARRSLAQHWNDLQPTQREEFVRTLRDLIEKNYVQRLRSNLDYQVDYRNEDVQGDDATVSTMVKVKTKGKSSETQIDYKLHKTGGRWMVWDVVTDDVSMVLNYKSQFHRIITQESFDALLRKMKKKIDETDETKPGGKTEKIEGGSAKAGAAKGEGERVAGGTK